MPSLLLYIQHKVWNKCRRSHQASLYNTDRCLSANQTLNRLLSIIFRGVRVTLQVMVYQVTIYSHHSDITVIAKTSKKSRCSQDANRVCPFTVNGQRNALLGSGSAGS